MFVQNSIVCGLQRCLLMWERISMRQRIEKVGRQNPRNSLYRSMIRSGFYPLRVAQPMVGRRPADLDATVAPTGSGLAGVR
jgi:hypothetical protein